MSRVVNYSSATTQMLLTSSATTGSYNFTTVTNASSAVTNAYTNADSTSYGRLQLSANRNSTRTSTVYFEFNKTPLSEIPSNATISSVTARVKYSISSTSYITAVSIQLHNNTTAKGSATTGRTTSATVYTMTAGTWTLSELQNIRLYVSATHSASNSAAYLNLYGVDVTVNYSVSGTEYEVSFNNQSSDATTDPSTTQYVFQGDTQEVKIYIDDKDDIVVKDNNVDVNSSLVEIPSANNVASVGTVAGASYGFTLDTSDNYYKSQNAGRASSAALCRLNITASTQCVLTIRYVNYAEGTYDYGIIGKLDTGLTTTTATTESGNWLWAGSASTDNTSSEQSIDISVPSGNHYLDIKYRKDNYSDENNDAFWFKYELNPGQSQHHYTYTISNIAADHTISIEDSAVGTFYNVNASSTYAGATITPATQSIREGRNANVQIAVNNLYEIVVKDNGTTVTNALVQNATGYTYTVTNVQAIHNITIEEATYYTVTTASTYAGATASANPSKVYAGRDSFVEVNVNHLYEIVVKDNGTVISLTEPIDTTGNFIPTEYDDEFSTNSGVYSQTYGYDNGLGDSESTSYCRAYLNTGAQAESRLSYKFDCSSIPENARITSVSCVVRAYCNGSTQYVPTREVQLYNGTTAKGTAGTLGTANGTVNVNGGTWTREELDDIRIVARCVRGNSNTTTNYYYYFYGASLAIEYEVPASYYLSNVQTNHAITIEEAPYYTVTINNAYQGATFTVDPQKGYSGIDVDVRIEVSDIDEIVVQDNGVNVNANIINVGSGVYRYTINAIAANHTISIVEATKYNITATSNYTAVTITPTSASVIEGHSQIFVIEGDEDTDLSADIVLLDNNVDVTSQMTRTMGETGTTSAVLGTFDSVNSDYVGVYTNSNNVTFAETNAEGRGCAEGISNSGLTASTVNLSRSSFYPATGAGSELVVFYNFNTPTIPEGATITNVSCNAAVAAAYNGSGYTQMSVQLCIGTTPVGTATPITTATTNATTHTIDGGSNWTASDLSNAKIKMYGVRNEHNSNNDNTGIRDNLNICGADIIVTYSLPGGYIYTVSNVQTAHTLVINEVPATYYNVNASSSYNEATISPATQSIRQNHTAKLQISAASIYDIVVKDNGVNVTSELVANETGFTYTTGKINGVHTITVEESESFDIITSSEYEDATISPASQSVRQGMSAITYIEVGSVSEISITDNGVEVGDQLVLVSAGTTYTASGILATFDETNSVYAGIYSSYVSTNAENHSSAEGMASTGSTRSAFYPVTGEGSELFIYYDFGEVSGIPQGSVITNVSAVVAMSTAYSGLGYSDVYVQLCKGTTPVGEQARPTIGSGVTNSTAAAQLMNVDGGSGWTLSDISNAKVLLYGIRNEKNGNNDTGGTRDNLCMHGADIIVTYSDGNSFNGFTYTLQNIQTGHTIVITENPEYTLTASSNVQDVTITPASATVRGRESVIFNISGDITEAVVLDNGIDVTTQLRSNSTGYTYTISSVTSAHTIVISEPSAESDYIKSDGVFKKVIGYYKKVNGTWTLIQKAQFDTQVSSSLVVFGGAVVNQTIGEVETSNGAINISIDDDALESGTYKMVYEDANKTPITGYTTINEFTIQ